MSASAASEATAAGARQRARSNTTLLVGSATGFLAGVGCHLLGARTAAGTLWVAVTVVGIVPAAWWVLEALRQRRVGADVVALLALVGALAVGEAMAGALITVMLASGRALEARANARAQRDMRLLVGRAPTRARRYDAAQLTEVAVGAVHPGDRLLVGPGDVVPVDGVVAAGVAALDLSALNGESAVVECEIGDPVQSGAVNAGGAFDLRATHRADDSTYAGIVRMVESASADATPIVRFADRFAGGFLLLSLAAAAAAWALSGSAVRAVAVLVVATPCPMILAAPVAIVSGLSRAARRGVAIKGGAVLERLAGGRVLLFDKTGTLTMGRPSLAGIVTVGGGDEAEVLRMAASLDQASAHVLAAALVRAARERGVVLTTPVDVVEIPGRGVRGIVDGHAIAVGKPAWLASTADGDWLRRVRRRAALEDGTAVLVEADGSVVGALIVTDPLRPDAPRTIRRARQAGLRRIVMVTGDRRDVAASVGAVLGVDAVLAECSPADKVEAVRLEGASGPTVMVGDGINDAPALAAADVGVAVAARGMSASSEAADVVLSVDRLDRVGEAILIAQRSARIARQSMWIGVGLSSCGMAGAAAGALSPAWGALAQELIDVAAILNALRALRRGPGEQRFAPHEVAVARRFRSEHVELQASLDRVRSTADRLDELSPADARRALADVLALLEDVIGPHEAAEEAELYPIIRARSGDPESTGAMTRAHLEIRQQIDRLRRVADDLGDDGPDPVDVAELRRLLYGLHAIVALHTAQEDESYLSAVDDAPGGAPEPVSAAPSG